MCSSLVKINKTVYFAEVDGNIYAVNDKDGIKKWVFETESQVRSSPAVVDDTVYIGDETNVYALDRLTGDLKWSTEVGNHPIDELHNPSVSSPAVVQNNLYVTFGDELFAIDVKDGTVLWKYGRNTPFLSSPTVVDNTIFIGYGTMVGGVLAIDRVLGTKRWKHKLRNIDTHIGGTPLTAPAVVGSSVYIMIGWEVFSLNVGNGEIRWCFDNRPHHKDFSSIYCMDDVIYLSRSGYIQALDRGTGDEIWQYPPENERESAEKQPIHVANGDIYVSSSTPGQLVCLTGADSDREDGQQTANIKQVCPTCDNDLSKYSEPGFCPECGTETAVVRNFNTEIYDP